MTLDDDDFELITSPLSGPFRQDGITVNVEIYRGANEPHWVLEVVDEDAASYLWHEQFASDQLAMDGFVQSVRSGGMKPYNPHYAKRSDLN